MESQSNNEKASAPVVESQETQEALLADLERSGAELSASTERLSGLLESVGGVAALPPEEQSAFDALKESALRKFEELKGPFGKIAGYGALGATGVAGALGFEELRQAVDVSKELVAIGLANVAVIGGFIALITSRRSALRV